MAAVESLLKLMASQGAEALVVASGEVPILVRAGARVTLSMPRLDPGLVSSFVEGVATPEEVELLEGGRPVERRYEAPDGGGFLLKMEHVEGGYRLRFVAAAGSRADAAAPRPPPRSAPPVEPSPPPTPEPGGDDVGRAASAPSGGTGPAPSASSTLLAVVDEAIASGASDLLLSSGEPPWVRVGGGLRPVPGPPVDEASLLGLLEPTMREDHREALASGGSVDLGVEIETSGGPSRLRINLFRHEGGLAAALRPIHHGVLGLEELGLPPDLAELAAFPNGLVLMTGPAGSGKSTTLAALVEHVNRTRACHVITLEDPIEHTYRPGRSAIHQREVGRHVASFAEGLRAALRESPDIILVGEMRDLATISAALVAAETGHLVLSTLHTGSAATAVDRIVDAFPDRQRLPACHQLAGALRAVVTQLLLPTRTPPARVPVIEKLVVTDAVARKIREGQTHQIDSQIQTGGEAGMISRERSLAALVRSGRITLETALRACRDEAGLRRLVQARR